jgi:hypothetical protein
MKYNMGEPSLKVLEAISNGQILFTSDIVSKIIYETDLDLPNGEITLNLGSANPKTVAVGRAEYMTRMLNDMVNTWSVGVLGAFFAPKPSEAAKYFKEIEKGSRRLLHLIV